MPLEELAGIAHGRGLVLIDDVGAGALVDLSPLGLDAGPTLAELDPRQGPTWSLSSTDKLIGGPQGGVILGKAGLVEAVRKNPLARIVRVGKLTLAALEATLLLFFDEERALGEVPTLRMVCRRLADIAAQAERIAAADRRTGRARRGGGGGGRRLADGRRLVARPGPADAAGGGPARTASGPDELAARLRRGSRRLRPHRRTGSCSTRGRCWTVRRSRWSRRSCGLTEVHSRSGRGLA